MLSVLILLIAAGSQADTSWVGFKKIDDASNVPHAELAKASVFKVVSYNAVSERKFKIVKVRNEKKTTDRKTLDTDYRAIQIETCRRYKIENCPVSTRYSSSTIVFNSPSNIHACRHSFHNWMAMATKINEIPIKEIHFPVKIYDHNDKIIYNSAYSEPALEIKFLNTADRLNVVYDEVAISTSRPQFELYTGVTDYIALRSSQAILGASKLDIADPKTGRVFVYGYPGKTSYFGGVNKGDTPGNVLVATSGTMNEYNDTRKQLLADPPIGPGMSGGAILNADGKLVGIACAGDKDRTVGISTDEAELTEFWKKLEALPLD